MKLIGKLFGFVFLVAIVVIILGLGYMGYIPVVAKFLGTDKPRDLGIRFSEKDRDEAKSKSKVQYGVLPSATSDQLSIQRFGHHDVDDSWSSAQISAMMNDRPWKYWPYKNVQLKFYKDGSGEMSGGIDKVVFPNYASAKGVPKEAISFMMKLLPPTPVFYLKMKVSIKNNKIDTFQPQAFELNRIPLPVAQFLAFNRPSFQLIKPVNAQLNIDLLTDLAKVKNKKDLIVGFINDRLADYNGSFFADELRFEEDKFIFKGILPDQEATVR